MLLGQRSRCPRVPGVVAINLLGRDNRFVHSKDGGRTWRGFGLPFRAGSHTSIDLLRGPKPRIAVMCADGIMLLDAGPAGSALFTRPLAASP